MPRKRQAEAVAAEPVAKRRSARQAQKGSESEVVAPALAYGPSEEPVKASEAKAKAKGDGNGNGNEVKGPGEKGDDASKRVAEPKGAGKAESKPKPKQKPEKQSKSKPSKPTKAVSAGEGAEDGEEAAGGGGGSPDPDFESIPTRSAEAERHEGEWYWLMKAEPEPRFESGIDVSFSIDDLRATEVPEPWDGIRSYAARNNLRAMNAGDKSFFYHSNCKEPGIVGIMEIVKEFSPDTTARRPGTAYYDPSSTKEKPKWGLVHVRFVKKFAVPIFLKELKEMGAAGDDLEDMQMLKQSRLSVSRVGGSAWEYLCGLADRKAGEAGLEHEVDSCTQ